MKIQQGRQGSRIVKNSRLYCGERRHLTKWRWTVILNLHLTQLWVAYKQVNPRPAGRPLILDFTQWWVAYKEEKPQAGGKTLDPIPVVGYILSSEPKGGRPLILDLTLWRVAYKQVNSSQRDVPCCTLYSIGNTRVRIISGDGIN